MNKTEFINTAAIKTGTSRRATKLMLDSLTDSIAHALSKNQKVTLVGFGSWDVVKLAPRTGRNPRTSEPIQIKGRKKVRFKAGAELSDKVN